MTIKKKYIWICKYCGGDNISMDASVSWDRDKQDWEINDFRDDDWCGTCDAEVRTTELYSTEEQYPTGTKKAVWVDSFGEDNDEGNTEFVILTDKVSEVHATHLPEGEKYAADYFSIGEIVTLEKLDEYHWIYKEELNGKHAD